MLPVACDGEAAAHGLHDLAAGAYAYLRTLDLVHRALYIVRDADGQLAVYELGYHHNRALRIGVFFDVGYHIVKRALEIERVCRYAALALELYPLHAKAGVYKVKLRLAEELFEQEPSVEALKRKLKLCLAVDEEVPEQLVRQLLEIHRLCVG